MRRILSISLLLLLAGSLLAQSAMQCVVCRRLVQEGYEVASKFYCKEHVDAAFPQCANCRTAIKGNYVALTHREIPICMTCREGFAHCFLCSMPSDPARGGNSLKDGRPLCAAHRKDGVVDPAQARAIFAEARRQLETVFGASIRVKTPIKSVELVDLAGLRRAAGGGSHHSGMAEGKVLGITTLSIVTQGSKQWLEPATVHLLNYVPVDRMLSVAAHEYAHVWQAENHRDYSSTNSLMREGFAEWVAYKLAQHYRREEQMKLIQNPAGGIYYQGLQKYLAMEKKSGVQGVFKHATTAYSL